MITEQPLVDHVDIRAAYTTYGAGAYGDNIYGLGLVLSLLPDATGVRITRGGTRTGLGIKTDVGIMTFVLRDVQDPLDGAVIAPGHTVQALTDDGEIFTGKIAHIDTAYPLDKETGQSITLTTVTVADAVHIHGTTPRYGVATAEGYETFEARISRLKGSARAAVAAPPVGDPRVVYAL